MAIEIFKIVTSFAEPINRIYIDPITWQTDINKNYLERKVDCQTCGKYWRKYEMVEENASDSFQ